jgi:hypothetical protein
VFVSWPFFVSLAILLINDYYLKATYSNWLTGKLSDFAGIFLVSLVLFALMPSRIRVCGCIVTTLFALWKSPVVEPFVDFVRASGITNFGRVVDYTDLIALIMVPLAAFVSKTWKPAKPIRPRLQSAFALPAITLFVFAVTGTSIATFTETYTIQKSAQDAVDDPQDVLKVLNLVAEEHGLRRVEGDETSHSGQFTNKYFTVTYSIDSDARMEVRTIDNYARVFFRGPADKKMRRFKKSLRDELGLKFNDLEFVEPIP